MLETFRYNGSNYAVANYTMPEAIEALDTLSALVALRHIEP